MTDHATETAPRVRLLERLRVRRARTTSETPTSETAIPEAPTLPAVSVEDGRRWAVWCRWCDKFHLHAPEAGHAVAHCLVADSPYHGTGYRLVLVPGDRATLTPRRRERRRPRSEGRRTLHGWRDR